MLEDFKNYAPLVTGAITAVSAVIALLAFFANRQSQKEALVQKAYYDYAKMAVDMPELAFPPRQAMDLQKETLNGNGLEFERYEWFLSAMLVTVHFVMRIRGGDRFWRALTTNQISYHWRYLEYFWDSKPFILNWRSHLGAQMAEGVEKGKAKFKSKIQVDAEISTVGGTITSQT